MFQKIFLLILCALNIQQGERCRLNSRIHFGEPLPVILRNGRLLEPTDSSGNVLLDFGESMTLSCEGSGNLFHPNQTREEITASITCAGGENFRNDNWLNAPARFSQFRCSMPPNYVSRRTEQTCFESNPIYEVGYIIQNEFYALYESCFNEETLNAVYSKYSQKPYNAMFQTRVDRPFFISNGVYGHVPVDSLFSPKGQKAAVAQVVGPLVDTYMTMSEFLSRGHLAAKTDFVFAFGERATFHYVNCAPQWYGFNGGNWNTLEVDLRNHVHDVGYNTIIYTGTYGVTTLMTDYGHRANIYLYNDENNNPVIPVPLYFYKVVYEPSTKRGIAFVGINNPYVTAVEARDLFFCRDLCRGNSDFHWLSWHPNNSSEGYTFCCTIPDFRGAVGHLPQFEVNGLLT
ncbi:Alkaline nuclease [Operophtera brumata]|uniref:Alkaline nuclease n=1 Tax=Operophtera brumata TaxID=104452 RepID=A0A0L7LLE8_OPEBR|nr:Alkaline nuclease [Operophtera brumata]